MNAKITLSPIWDRGSHRQPRLINIRTWVKKKQSNLSDLDRGNGAALASDIKRMH
jgi:hypothetical protein